MAVGRYIQRHIQDLGNIKMKLYAKIVNVVQQLTIFAKYSILDIWKGSEHTLTSFNFWINSFMMEVLII